ncbi:MAG: ABC transporter ATP-binding protein [Candidatus Eisenbacteria bacterium]|uniref:ABC transporter ATP-binding protein n=1 Tax=Eiseniibacteriota bacterium TaxID=2212470 RepID=A0A849SJ56_UNCEI|nr:ABC transporter ATP-binding protein [Candidatus Eisenbacteria bacterium]
MNSGSRIDRFRTSLARSGRVLRFFAPTVRPQAGRLAVALALSALAVLAEVLRPLPLQVVIDQVLVPNRAPHPSWLAHSIDALPVRTLIIGAALATLLASALAGLFEYVRTIVLSEAAQRVVARIRRDLFRHLMILPSQWHTRRSHGDVLLRLTGDIVMLRELLVGSLLDAAASVLLIVGTLGMMLWLDAGLTLISLVAVPPVAVLGTLLTRKIRRVVRRTREKEGALAGRSGEALGAVAMLQAFGAAAQVAGAFERENRSNLRSSLKASRLEALLARSLDLMTSAGVAVTIVFGTFAVLRGDLTAGGLIVFLTYQRVLYRPLRRLAQVVSRSAKAAVCGERVAEVLRTVPTITDRVAARTCERASGRLEFENVGVRYERGDLALDDVSFEVPAGSIGAIRGESGAGKSTLLALVPRLVDPTSGRVLLDGVDLREYTLESLRRQVAVVFQDSVLLGLTVSENIALGDPDATQEAIHAAAECAGVHRFAAELPNGFDTVVGERGAELSGGQRQRIAIARATLRNAPILVLDEPFAHLDDASRDHVLAALRTLAKSRTVLIVTHREHPGLVADFEIVLAGGRVASHRSLAGVA